MPDGKRKSITPAIIATIADNQNRERTPPSAATIGPMINATKKENPMPIPKNAIDRVLTSFLVASESNAVKAEEIAPIPCNKRPPITPIIVSLSAATTLPTKI